jgi:hypothetical protein
MDWGELKADTQIEDMTLRKSKMINEIFLLFVITTPK